MAFDYAAKIQALLANAEDEALPDTLRAEMRAKADQFMRDYNIAQEELIAADPFSAVPISKKFLIRSAGAGRGDLNGYYTLIFSRIAMHTGIRYATEYDENYAILGTMVGYDGDIAYAEFLWTAAYLMFSTRIDPVWNSALSEDENIFILRSAGIERKHIADMAWGNGHEAAARSKVQRIYVRECARRNEPVLATGLGFNTSLYRAEYAQQFVTTLNHRLREARDASDSLGGALVLAGREDRVDEAFYDLFPRLRPSTEVAESYVAPNHDCAKCKAAASGFCREHGYLKPRAWTQSDEAAAQRRQYSASARAGRGAGRAAADGVNVQRGHTRATRLDPSGVAIEN